VVHAPEADAAATPSPSPTATPTPTGPPEVRVELAANPRQQAAAALVRDDLATLLSERFASAGHAVGVVHRDLSSNNVRRLSNGTYKVLDFGFARHTLLSGITVAGQPGTPGFLSPEHLNSYSGGPMPASDVFGVGILMYLSLTGVLPIPYTGDDDDYVRRVIAVDIPRRLSDVRPDLSDTHRGIVERCLHPQPARRFRSAERLAAALEALA
jgi:serine/threonine-protein kinase